MTDIPLSPDTYTGPVHQADRIVSLDVLRGFAVLGILIMNIQAFSMVGAAYFNPTAYGDLNGLNYLVWLFSHVLANTKFITIFSMLFGAGIVLMTDRQESAGRRPAPVHYRRMFILLLFGLAHAYLLWDGDILYAYAMCGFLIYFFRKLNPKLLLILGFTAIGVGSLLALFFHWSVPYWPEEQLQEMMKIWAPSKASVIAEVEAYRGSWSAQNVFRIPVAIIIQTISFATEGFWRAGGLMLVGMALFKLGVFNADLSRKIYRTMVVLALVVGIPVVLFGVHRYQVTDWAFETGFFLNKQYNYWASILVSFGWIGLVMLGCQRSRGGFLHRSLAATGQMALTNYLLQTLICTTIFYGHGFALFGQVERTGQILIVFGIWIFQLILSTWWLSRFRFGPFEWLWRSLSYLKVQPLRL